jgi:hypothetical protein
MILTTSRGEHCEHIGEKIGKQIWIVQPPQAELEKLRPPPASSPVDPITGHSPDDGDEDEYEDEEDQLSTRGDEPSDV